MVYSSATVSLVTERRRLNSVSTDASLQPLSQVRGPTVNESKRPVTDVFRCRCARLLPTLRRPFPARLPSGSTRDSESCSAQSCAGLTSLDQLRLETVYQLVLGETKTTAAPPPRADASISCCSDVVLNMSTMTSRHSLVADICEVRSFADATQVHGNSAGSNSGGSESEWSVACLLTSAHNAGLANFILGRPRVALSI